MECGHCDFKTSSRKALREHAKVHQQCDKPFTCPKCSYNCVSSSTLRVHMRIHSEHKPYPCPYCNYAAKQSGNMRIHIKRKHPDRYLQSMQKKEGLDKFPVVTAEEKDSKRWHTLKPIVRKPFQCPLCDQAFVREDSLRSHVKHHRVLDEEMAQTVESTALAVLQLQNPVNLTTNATGQIVVSQSESGTTAQIVVAQSEAEAIEVDQETDSDAQVHEDDSHASEDAEVEGEQVSEASEVASEVQVIQTTVAASSSTGTATMAQKKTTKTIRTRPTLSAAQTSNNLLAIMQNNQNRAVEDNIQNAAISASRASTVRVMHRHVSPAKVQGKSANLVFHSPVTPPRQVQSGGQAKVTGQTQVISAAALQQQLQLQQQIQMISQQQQQQSSTQFDLPALQSALQGVMPGTAVSVQRTPDGHLVIQPQQHLTQQIQSLQQQQHLQQHIHQEPTAQASQTQAFHLSDATFNLQVAAPVQQMAAPVVPGIHAVQAQTTVQTPTSVHLVSTLF